MHEGHPACAGQTPETARVGGERARHLPEAARAHQRASQDGERPDEHVDARVTEVVGERPVVRKHRQGHVALRIEPRGDRVELAVGSVAARGAVEVEDGPGAHTTTSSARSPGRPMRPGWST